MDIHSCTLVCELTKVGLITYLIFLNGVVMSVLNELNLVLSDHAVDLDRAIFLGSLHTGYTCELELFLELAKDTDEIAIDFVIIFSDLSYVNRRDGSWVWNEDIINPTRPTTITNLGKNDTHLWVYNAGAVMPKVGSYGLAPEQSPLAFLAGFGRETK